jgi:tetratricopeptide (TPR) repeat protein
MLRWIEAMFLIGFLASNAQAAGSEPEPSDASDKSGEAFREFNEGIRHRNKAWDYEQKAAGVEDADVRKPYQRIAKGEYGKAIASFRKAIELAPSLHQPHGSLGYVLRKTGDYDGALAAYARSIDLKPDYELAIEYRGETYLELNRIDAARGAYLQLKKLKSKYASVLLKRISEWTEGQQEGGDVSADALAKMGKWVEEESGEAEVETKESLW